MKAAFASTILATLVGLPLSATAADLKQMSDLYNAGYLPVNEMNAPLLHFVHTAKPFDTWAVLNGAGSVLPAEIGAKYRLYHSTPSLPEKNRIAGELTDFTRDLAENMRLAKGYIVKLTYQAAAYDARKQVLPIGLTIPADKTDATYGRYYCPGSFARIDGQLMTSCLTVRKWESAHGELKEIPLADKTLADMIAARLADGSLAFHALLQPEGPYQPARPAATAIPGQPDKAIAGAQPVRLIGLALVNQQSGGIVNVATIDPSASIFRATEGAGTQGQTDPAAPPKAAPPVPGKQ